jgi:hypothetical protein
LKRRRFLASLLFLPCLTYQPAQHGGIEPFNCDADQVAVGFWYVPTPATLIVDWHIYDQLYQMLRYHREVGRVDRANQLVVWFTETRPHHQLLAAEWKCAVPAFYITGTCVL